jgi:hypothetical protein
MSKVTIIYDDGSTYELDEDATALDCLELFIGSLSTAGFTDDELYNAVEKLYDSKKTLVEVDLGPEFILAAHEAAWREGVTFNDLVTNIIKEKVKEVKE